MPVFARIPTVIAALAMAALLTSTTYAQDETGAPPIDPEVAESQFKFTVDGGYLYGFSADFEDTGDVQNSRAQVGADVAWRFVEDWNLSLSFTYVLDSYDFSTPNGLAAVEPWSDINQVDFGFVLNYNISSDWSVWGGGIFEFSFENGAAWDDSFTAGGLFGVTCVVNDDLILGGGLAVVQRIEDDVRFVPIVIVNWNITNDLVFTSRTSAAFAGAALELIWKVQPWEFAIGGVHKYSRFRLDDDVVAPDGVGQDESIPLYGRIGYHFNKDFQIDVLAGAACFGEMTLEDSGGNKISDEDYDPALFIGAYLKLTF